MKPLKLTNDSDEDSQESLTASSASPRDRPRKRVCRNEVPKYMWPQKKVAETKQSPLCVASMATAFLPQDMQLNSPKTSERQTCTPMPTLTAEEDADEQEGGHDHDKENFAPLFQLQGIPLMEALQKARAEDYISYSNGHLNRHVTPNMTNLYSHVLEQGDVPNGEVYGDSTPLNRHTQLPVYYPKNDAETGLSRAARLAMARDCDVWQWCAVSQEDFSLLDTLVWMGVQMQRLYADDDK